MSRPAIVLDSIHGEVLSLLRAGERLTGSVYETVTQLWSYPVDRIEQDVDANRRLPSPRRDAAVSPGFLSRLVSAQPLRCPV